MRFFQNLTQHGYDVFFDYSGTASGDFEHVILENIRARAHFLVLLTPSALERCSDRSDWFRREIETALASQRNIVPLLLEGFDFGTPEIADQLTGTLSALKYYNALRMPPEYFDEAIQRLRERFLNIPFGAVIHPAPPVAVHVAIAEKTAAKAAPAVQFDSCFISYSTKDEEFANRLYANLTNRGVRCWFSSHDIEGGKKIQEQINRAIFLYDRLLLILSEHSLKSNWVKTEIATARKRELRENRRMLFPIRLVDFDALREWECFDPDTGMDSASEIRGYFIPDLRGWKERPDVYQNAFERLIKDLIQNP